MFRIRRVYDDIAPVNKRALNQIERILKNQFFELTARDITRVTEQICHPQNFRFKPILFVADNHRHDVEGFAYLSYFPDLRFCFLDYLASKRLQTSRGIGGALYMRVRKEALMLDSIGLFFECLPDDPRLCKKPKVLKQNQARLRFYEHFGAYPIINTLYETPVKLKQDNPPYMVFDPLNRPVKLHCDMVRSIIKAILVRKYPGVCSPQYVKMVVNSFKDDPVKIRVPRYLKKNKSPSIHPDVPSDKKIICVVNDRHHIHHVKDKGYVETPVRIKSILKDLNRTELFERIRPKNFPEKHITAVHDREFVRYLKRTSAQLRPKESVYPYIFPLRNRTRPPVDLTDRAGYYCIDTFTPLNRKAYIAAKRAVDCTLTAAQTVLRGHRLAYALVRPPGHHAERHVFGGFCYFNSAAVAAQYLSAHGKVAMLDLDHHHGNGQQDIFYHRKDVLTVSVHVHPRFDYPIFTGFKEERGQGEGMGYNINFPLAKYVDGNKYLSVIHKALKPIRNFHPQFVVMPLGFDTAKRDPTGTWRITSKDFRTLGSLVASLNVPILVVQEGGYNNRFLGINARYFFSGLWEGIFKAL